MSAPPPAPGIAKAVASPAPVALVGPIGPTPSRRSDWPAAIGRAPEVTPAPRLLPAGKQRQEGTDGYMGGLPFGLPGDVPLVPVGRHDRFELDPVLPPAANGPRTFRLDGLSKYRVDPFQR